MVEGAGAKIQANNFLTETTLALKQIMSPTLA